MFQRFEESDLHNICDSLAMQDKDLHAIISRYGYPPVWSRPNTFEALVHIILEQQVSLASALATLNRLKEKIKEITPANVMTLSDAELRACYFSRQKTVYVRALAEAILNGGLSLDALAAMDDHSIRDRLTVVKGIGNWTTDIYLIFVLHHADVFPLGDLAAVNALKKIKQLPASYHKEGLLPIADSWKPYRTVAVMLLWHFYLEERKSQHRKVAVL